MSPQVQQQNEDPHRTEEIEKEKRKIDEQIERRQKEEDKAETERIEKQKKQH